MKLLFWSLMVISLFLTSCWWQGRSYQLKKSPSLYTQAVAKIDKVHWHTWGKNVLEKAKQENKLILLMAGYHTCHLCRNQVRELQESRRTLRLIRRKYLAAAIDVFEFPQISTVLATASRSVSAVSGWPMVMILSPDGWPLWASSGKLSSDLPERLYSVSRRWQKNSGLIEAQNEAAAKTYLMPRPSFGKTSDQLQDDFVESTIRSLDTHFGGVDILPKSFLPEVFSELLAQFLRTENQRIQIEVFRFLDAVSHNAVYDAIRGGFFAGSRSGDWNAPYFEKRLDDQVTLGRLFLQAYFAFEGEEHLAVAQHVLQFIESGLTTDEGLLMSLGSECLGQKGGCYQVKYEDILSVLTEEEVQGLNEYYGIYKREDQRPQMPRLRMRHRFGRTTSSVQAAFAKIRTLQASGLPPIEDPVERLSSVSQLISFYAEMSRATGRLDVFKHATELLERVKDRFQSGQQLYRLSGDRRGKIAATLLDWGRFVEAHLSLYLASGDPEFLQEAMILQARLESEFLRPSGRFREVAREDDVWSYQWSLWADNLSMSSQALNLRNLIFLYQLTRDGKYKKRAESTVKFVPDDIEKQPMAFASTITALRQLSREREVYVRVFAKKTSKRICRWSSALTHDMRDLVCGTVGSFQVPSWRNLKLKSGSKSTLFRCYKGECVPFELGEVFPN